LEKKAADRWQTAEDLLPQLEALMTPSGGVTPTETQPVPAASTRHRKIKITAIASAAALAVGAAVALFLPEMGAALVPNRVVIAVFENQTGDPSLDPVGRMAADWITQGLQATGLVDVVPSPTALQASQHAYAGAGSTGDPVRALADETAAGLVVSGVYYRLGDSIQFQVQVTNAREGRLLYALDAVSGSQESLRETVGLLRQRVAGTLATFLDERVAASALVQSQPPTFEAYQQYSDGLDLYVRREYAAAIPHFYEAASLDSTFTAPLILAAFCLSNIGRRAEEDSVLRVVERFREQLPPYDRYSVDALRANMTGDHAGAYRAYRSAAELAPGSKLVYNYAREARRINRPREAVRALEQLNPERGAMRGWIGYWGELSLALHMLGDDRQALEVGQRARRLYPQRLSALYFEALSLATLGRVDELAELLDQGQALSAQPGPTLAGVMTGTALELRAHGQPEAARQLLGRAIRLYETSAAEAGDSLVSGDHMFALYEAERWDEVERAGEALLRALPTAWPLPTAWRVRAGFGLLAARRGDRDQAEQVSAWLRDLDRPYLFGRHTVLRARIAAVLGEHERAVNLLKEAFAQGSSYGAIWHLYLDFASLQDYPPFQELMRPKG
jgi:tetratricopeptide (TPR) repeat protein